MGHRGRWEWVFWWAIVLWVVVWVVIWICDAHEARATTVSYQFTAPSSDQRVCPGQDDWDSLSTLPPLPLTGLVRFQVWGVRFRDADTLMLGEIPCVGCAGQTIGFDLDLLPGTMGSVWVKAFDQDGNVSCKRGAESVFAVPLQESAQDSLGHGAGLRAELFSDREQTVAAGERVDSLVAFDWQSGAAWLNGPVDNFSIRWSGILHVPTSGVWNLYVQSDDGRRLWLDGAKVMDFWVPTWSEGQWAGQLAAGDHALRLDYFEAQGGALVTLQWAGPGQGKSTVTAQSLTH